MNIFYLTPHKLPKLKMNTLAKIINSNGKNNKNLQNIIKIYGIGCDNITCYRDILGYRSVKYICGGCNHILCKDSIEYTCKKCVLCSRDKDSCKNLGKERTWCEICEIPIKILMCGCCGKVCMRCSPDCKKNDYTRMICGVIFCIGCDNF